MAKKTNLGDILEIHQTKYYSDDECKELLNSCEKKFKFYNEINTFEKLVNFSTAKNIPYQRWVRYREGYSTALVKELISRAGISRDEDFIADPMMGSGSTLLAAAELGYDALGVDVNPYCEKIAAIKLLRPTNDDLESVEQFISNLSLLVPDEHYKDYILDDYFPSDNLKYLKMIKKEIDRLQESPKKQILFVAWLFCLEDSSNRKKDGNGLATRPAPVSNVVEYYSKIIKSIILDYRQHPLNAGNYYLKSTTAFNLSECVHEFEQQTLKKLGAVIFSPPYANSFDYFESYKLELLFGGLLTHEDFNSHKKDLVRNYRISYGKEIKSEIPWVEALCREIWASIPIKETMTGKRDGRTRLMPNMIRGYFTDMKKVLNQIFISLKSGGKCFVVVDQSSYVGIIIPTDVILAYLAEEVGFKVESISVCRRASTSGQQIKQYPYLKATLRESIVTLEK